MKKISITLMIICFVALLTSHVKATRYGYDIADTILMTESVAQTPSMLKLQRINVSHVDSSLCVSFDINPQKVHPGSDRQIVFTPVIRNLEDADSVVLAPVIIAGRNRYFSHVRKGDVYFGDSIYRAGEKKIIRYIRNVTWSEWMATAFIFMREETQDCCRPVKPLCNTPIAQINTLEKLNTNTPDSIYYIPLTGDSTIELETQGRAFVDFHVNKWDIDEKYRNNASELDKIIESVNLIKNDPDAVITRLTIKGFASPEGKYDNNVRLAMGRTEALKEYVRKKYDFDPDILMTSYEAEDWEGLKAWLDTCPIPHREEIIAIVESDLDPDSKDETIRQRYPKEYKILLDDVYPSLRHSDYSIRYKIRVYATDEELKKVYNSYPERLRPVDFYRIANFYPFGSEDFQEALIMASDFYPNDQDASVNAANIFINRGELEKAAQKLAKAGEGGEAYFSRGLLATINGDIERAKFLFKKAKDLGVERASKKIDLLQQSVGNEIITYFIQVDE